MNTVLLQLLASKEARTFAKQFVSKNPELVFLGVALCVAYCAHKNSNPKIHY